MTVDVCLKQCVKLSLSLGDTNIYVLDKQGNNIGNTENKIKIITEHFTSFFRNENAIPLPECKKTTLQNPFTVEEVKTAIKSLKNNKNCAGCDLLRAEYLKYAPDLLHEEIAELLKTGDYPKELRIGLLVPLQKPGKKKEPPENLRPVVILSTLRKVPAICTIMRINAKVRQDIITNTQAAYSAGRSTTELVSHLNY